MTGSEEITPLDFSHLATFDTKSFQFSFLSQSYFSKISNGHPLGLEAVSQRKGRADEPVGKRTIKKYPEETPQRTKKAKLDKQHVCPFAVLRHV